MRPAARAANKPTAGNLDGQWTHDLHSLNNPAAQQPPRGPRGLRTNRNTDRMHSALNGSASSPALRSQFNIVGSAKPNTSISIRGIAGPYPVIIKNLAKGTTAADAESAMVPLGGVVLSCRLIAVQPQVIAEVVFETKEGADNVVDTLNNQNVRSAFPVSSPTTNPSRPMATSSMCIIRPALFPPPLSPLINLHPLLDQLHPSAVVMMVPVQDMVAQTDTLSASVSAAETAETMTAATMFKMAHMASMMIAWTPMIAARRRTAEVSTATI